MITEDRIRHCLGVARKCYVLAKTRGGSEETARKAFVVGLLHDVGYEFVEGNIKDHPKIGGDILSSITTRDLNEMASAIYSHGDPVVVNDRNPYELILQQADMSVNFDGKDIDYDGRLESVGRRHGQNSEEYARVKYMIDQLKKAERSMERKG